jgi:Spy/CpxP family protein refolding chaperone
MKDNILKFILAISLILNVSLLATAGYVYYKQSINRPPAHESELLRGGFLFEELSLRPDQAKAMQQKAAIFHAEIDKRRQAIRENRLLFIDLVRQDPPDKEAIDASISEINDMQKDMQKMVAAHILEVKADLDKDQQQKFLSLLQDAMTKRTRGPWF